MSFERDIAALKSAVGAATDSELADKLGVQRFAVSKWRQRETLPRKYLALIASKEQGDFRSALDYALRIHLFGKVEQSYWLRAALAVFPFNNLARPPSNSADTDEIERAMLELMGLAITATNIGLKQEYCRDAADCDRVIQILKTDFADEIDRIASRLVSGDG